MSSTSGNPGSAGTSLPDDVEATHRSVKGHLVLSPKFVRHFLNLECRDKQDVETYKQYFERLRGSAFSSKEWKNLCNFTSEILDTSKDLDEMDITVLGYLYNCAFKVKDHQGDTSKVLEAITHLKNLRNEVMHSIGSVNNPGALAKLEDALQSWIDVAGSFYSLLPSEINELKKELKNDIETGFSQGKIKLLYSCACVVKEDRADVQRFVRGNFKNDTLMFGMGQVERSAVFHSLEIRNLGDDNQTFPFTEIFKQSENIVIVSGIAGAGKSTLLENIALQFIEPHSGTSAYLAEFDLLVYVQCRDRTTRSLRDVIEQQFKDVCVKIGYEYVTKAIFCLRVIFLVDGFDECTQSTKVVEEIVRGTNGTSCRLIITSRPNAVARFKHQLSGRSWKEFEIVPLEKIEEQLNFLKKYELHLPGQQSPGALRGSFKTMSAPLRKLFVQPIKLLQFCSVFVTFPDKILKWKSPSDAARDIFDVYKNTVTKKLANLSYPDFDIVIDDLFEVLCDAALDFLRHDKLIFTEDDIKRIRKKCRRKLKDEHEIKDLDTKIVLSSVLKMKMSPFGGEAASFSFHHKTDEEYFASMSVVEKLSDYKTTLKNILLGQEMAAPDVGKATNSETTPKARSQQPHLFPMMQLQSTFFNLHPPPPPPPLYSFLQVLQYVVQDLSANHHQLFLKRQLELKEALNDAGANFFTWENLALNCADNAVVVKWVAETALAVGTWVVKTEHDLEAVALMLPYAQPAELAVVIHPLSLVGEHWTKIAQLRVGNLHLKLLYTCGVMYTHYTPCDNALLPLQNCRCRLVEFEGLLATAQGVTSLASVTSPWTKLGVWLQEPLDLSVLEGKYKSLTLHTPPFAPEEQRTGPMPLPERPLPNLVVESPLPDSWEAVVHTVLTLAPAGKRYSEVTLSRCEMNDTEVDRVLVALQRKGVRTHKVVTIHELNDQIPSMITRKILKFKDSGKIKRGPDYQLVVTTSLPAAVKKVSTLLVLMNRLTKLSTSDSIKLRTQWPQLKKNLRAAGASYKDWQNMMLRCPNLPDLPSLAAEATLAKNLNWIMETGRDVDAVALMLPHARPSALFVNMEAVKVKGTRWPEVLQIWDGDLSLNLQSDHPCDEELLPLQQTCCRLQAFKGRIATDVSVASIAAVATPETVLEVWMETALQLGGLEGKYRWLGVHTRPIHTSDRERNNFSLPPQPSPMLTVEMSALTSWQTVLDTVLTLAPISKRYSQVDLQNCKLNPADLDKLMTTLHEHGIRTTAKIQGGAGRLIAVDKVVLSLADDLSLVETDPYFGCSSVSISLDKRQEISINFI